MGSQQSKEECFPPPPPPRPPFLFNLSRGELVRRQRLIDEKEERLNGYDIPCGGGGGVPYSKRQTERSSIVDYVNRALRHHNAHDPGAEFEPVKALVYASVGFRRARWVHVGFLARKRSTANTRARPVKPPKNAAGAAAAGDDPDVRRGRERRRRSGKRDEAPEPPDSQFFAELRFDDYDSAAVVACTIIDKSTPRGFKTKCGFCPESFGILHPGDGKFACGKRSQRNEFFLLRNRLLLPYTWPKKESEEEEPCPGPDRRNLGWIPTPLTFSENSHQGFSCLLLVSYCLDRVWHVHDVNWSR